jgi:hypothetical protein
MALPILCLFVCLIAACSKKAAPANAADDPNRPAVVKEPAPILYSDTAKRTAAAMDSRKAQSMIFPEYAFISMAMVRGDRSVLAGEYLPDAQLILPDTTVRGAVNITGYLIALSRAKSLSGFQRITMSTTVVDSVAADTGRYQIVTKRQGADEVFDTGSYRSEWRLLSDGSWKLVSDRLSSKGKAFKKK